MESKRPNRLIHEKSPYLLQHAYNPVDWYPWSDEAFARARKENKPIFLSIGYSTCHWCHVMEEESFEDEVVAGLLNETFVCIKVDREERPDIDNIYISIAQMMTGRGGWPLTIIMTPEKKPFFAATYMPKENKFGRTGMLDLVPHIKEIWQSRRDEIINSAEEIAKTLEKVSEKSPGEGLGKNILDMAYREISESFDDQYGGFGSAPKFPTPHKLGFLLRYWKRTQEERTLRVVEKTLQAMRLGGIYDHVGFGFHRYSTDSYWLVPHFEKMLYDQALLAVAYIEAFQATGKGEYGQVAREIFTYVLRDMWSPQGGFYSAEDADSEGEEGKFYLWTESEVRSFLSIREAELAIKVFNIEKEGNFREEVGDRKTSKNILYQKKRLSEIAKEYRKTEEEIKSYIEAIRSKLFHSRKARVPPHKDDKILVDWNGLMIASLAKGSRVFDDPSYTEAAKRAADFILAKMLDEKGRLYHRYRDNEAGITGFLNDYAFFIWGLVELYETTFDVKHLKTALNLHETLLKHFWDEKSGGFFTTPDYGEKNLVRKKEIYDGAIPSGNSVAMMNLLRLARMTGNAELEAKASQIERAFADEVRRAPSAFAQFMMAMDFVEGPSYEIVIAGIPEAEDTKKMVAALRKNFVPNKVVLLRPAGEGEEDSEIVELAKFTQYLSPIEGKATAYVCQNYQCGLPTTDVGEMLNSLKVKERR